MYRVQVRVRTLTVSRWLREYCRPETFVPLCKECPEYGRNWSCPPGVPAVEEIAGKYRFAQVIGLKVLYDEWVRREAAVSPGREEELRQSTYGTAKKKMLYALLALEQEIPGSRTIMAGRCELCARCAREEGMPCRHPDELRYSYSGLGFDLGRISEELLEMPLLWQSGGLPEYNVAVATFLHT